MPWPHRQQASQASKLMVSGIDIFNQLTGKEMRDPCRHWTASPA